MLKRVREWMQGRFDAAMGQLVRQCVYKCVIEEDCKRLADLLAMHQAFLKEIRLRVVYELAADSCFAKQVADGIDLSGVAYHLDAEDVASHVDVDTDDIASKVADEIDVSDCVNYNKLAETLVSKLKEAWA